MSTLDDSQIASPGLVRRALRVAFVDQAGDAIGGAQRSLQLLLAHLPEHVEATVVLFRDGAFAREMRAAGYRVVIVEIPERLLEIQRERIEFGVFVPLLGAVGKLRTAIREIAPDVVYTNTVKAHFLAAIASRLEGIPCVAHLRDILDGLGRHSLVTVLALCTTKRIAISQAVKRTYGLPNTIVVPNPLEVQEYSVSRNQDVARTNLSLPLHVPLVGVVGRVNRWKGQDKFLHIAAKVAGQSNAHFAIVGEPIFRDPEFLEELRSAARQLGLADRLHFVPWLEDPRDAYAALDVHCNTSEREPFGRTIIEAAATGVPTVCFNDGGAPEAIAPALSRDIVPPGDLDAFARAILAYVRDPALREVAGRIAREFSTTFEASTHAQRITNILAGIPTVL